MSNRKKKTIAFSFLVEYNATICMFHSYGFRNLKNIYIQSKQYTIHLEMFCILRLLQYSFKFIQTFFKIIFDKDFGQGRQLENSNYKFQNGSVCYKSLIYRTIFLLNILFSPPERAKKIRKQIFLAELIRILFERSKNLRTLKTYHRTFVSENCFILVFLKKKKIAYTGENSEINKMTYFIYINNYIDKIIFPRKYRQHK